MSQAPSPAKAEKPHQAERRCIVSRQCGAPEQMLRFVADPHNVVVADLKASLPGRGAWVFARRALVEEAVKRKIFAHALKKPAQAPADLAEQVDKLLRRAALGNLSLARRSGAVITGAEKAGAALRAGRVALLLHALDAAADGRRKLAQAAHSAAVAGKKQAEEIKTLSLFTADELRLVFGGQNVIHIAIVRDKGAEGFIKSALRLSAYGGGE